jgi:hypothetical protein
LAEYRLEGGSREEGGREGRRERRVGTGGRREEGGTEEEEGRPVVSKG